MRATEQIRSLDDRALAGITILAMTANAFDEDRKKALAWYGWISIQTNCYRGTDQYITKQSGVSFLFEL